MSTVHILNQDIRPLCRFTDKKPDAPYSCATIRSA